VLLPLVDVLRCPVPHADSWLVASCQRMAERDIVEGVLGCPTCRAQYPIVDGAVRFDPPEPVGESGAAAPADDDTAERIAAFLDLTEPRGYAILSGAWAPYAPPVSVIAPTPIIVFNPPGAIVAQPGVSVVFCRRAVPFAGRSARGIAMDSPDGPQLAEVVVPGGRLLAPVATPVPAIARELARDERLWVAEREAADAPVAITPRR
jgi:uncharacterized protein YbaR (Trm112 family)